MLFSKTLDVKQLFSIVFCGVLGVEQVLWFYVARNRLCVCLIVYLKKFSRDFSPLKSLEILS